MRRKNLTFCGRGYGYGYGLFRDGAADYSGYGILDGGEFPAAASYVLLYLF